MLEARKSARAGKNPSSSATLLFPSELRHLTAERRATAQVARPTTTDEVVEAVATTRRDGVHVVSGGAFAATARQPPMTDRLTLNR
jgi:hypothetical protein